MGIDMGSIMKKVKAYSATSKGQKEITEATVNRLHTSKGSDKGLNEKSIVGYGYKLGQAIYSNAYENFPDSVSYLLSNFFVSEPVLDIGRTSNGKYIYYNVSLDFDCPPSSLYRPSLAKDKNGTEHTGEGINNIIALFENGYDTDHIWWGYWESHSNMHIRTKPYRPALGVIADAIHDWAGEVGAMAYLEIKFSESGIFNGWMGYRDITS